MMIKLSKEKIMEMPTNGKNVFISYSHSNSDRVMEFIQRLKQDGFSLWYDENIHNSVWSASIESALDDAAVVLLFVTPESLNSNNVFNEISFADNAKKSIFCIYLTDTNISDYSGWRLMLTKCQAFYAYRDGDDTTYIRLKKCLLDILEEKASTKKIAIPTLSSQNDISEMKEAQKKKARVFCIQKKFADAKKIYDEFIAEDMLDMDGYMGYIRVQSENYKKFEGTEIDEAIQIAIDISGDDDLSKFDPEYERYIERRKEYFAKLTAEKKKAESEKYNVGNIVTYGQYWQTNNRASGKTPIEWIVLRRDGNKALLLSKLCLDCKQFNTDYNNATWENSNARKWLNQKFINDAFKLKEQEKIIASTISNPDNAEYETSGGNETTDKIFLLSIDEAENLLNRDERQAKCTDYAKAQGVWVDSVTDTPYWWLRSPGGDPLLAAAVHYRGKVFIGGLNICVDDTAIRPALWLNIELN